MEQMLKKGICCLMNGGDRKCCYPPIDKNVQRQIAAFGTNTETLKPTGGLVERSL
jgi:hypothetical protein